MINMSTCKTYSMDQLLYYYYFYSWKHLSLSPGRLT